MLRRRVPLVMVVALAVGSFSTPRAIARTASKLAPAVARSGLFTLGPTWQSPPDPSRAEAPGEAIVGDFDGDGHADILWYVPGPHADELFFGGPKGVLVGHSISIYGSYEPVVGDFNGDGASDILWISNGPCGATNVWLGGGTRGAPFHKGFAVPNCRVPQYDEDGGLASNQPITGDFNGDGKTDIYWIAPHPYPSVLWFGDTTGFDVGSKSTAPTTEPEYFRPILGDFNGDHHTDVLWYQPGLTKLWLGGTTKFVEGSAPTVHGTYKVRAVDYNGDGSADLLWYAEGPADDMLWTGSPSGFVNIVHKPLVSGKWFLITGDFTGDGRTDIQWIFNTNEVHSSGEAPSWVGDPSGFRNGPAIPGYPQGMPVVADFDGDGHADIAWFGYPMPNAQRPITIWYGS